MKKLKKKTGTKAKLEVVAETPAIDEVGEFKKILDTAIAAAKEKRTAVFNSGPFGFIILKGEVWMLHVLDCQGLQLAKAGEPVNAKRLVLNQDSIDVNYTHKIRFSLGYELKPVTEDDDGIHQLITVHFTTSEGGRDFNIPEFAFKRILATACFMRKRNLDLNYGEVG